MTPSDFGSGLFPEEPTNDKPEDADEQEDEATEARGSARSKSSRRTKRSGGRGRSRTEKAEPVLDKLEAYLAELAGTALPKSALAKAVT